MVDLLRQHFCLVCYLLMKVWWQVDWEAILSPDVNMFMEAVRPWMYPSVKADSSWQNLPDVTSTFPTTGSVVAALSTYNIHWDPNLPYIFWPVYTSHMHTFVFIRLCIFYKRIFFPQYNQSNFHPLTFPWQTLANGMLHLALKFIVSSSNFTRHS